MLCGDIDCRRGGGEKEPNQETIQWFRKRNNGLNQGGCGQGSKKWLDSEYTSEVEVIEFANRLDMGLRKKRGVKDGSKILV